MPESLEADVQLDIGDALGRVEELRAALEDAVSAPPPVEIEADAGAVAPAIGDAIAEGSGEPAQIDADASAIEPAITEAVAGTVPPPVEVPVTADVSEAEAAIESLGDTAANTSADVGGLEDATGALAGASAVAGGDVGGLKDVAIGAGIASKGAVAGVAGFAAGVTTLAGKAIDAISVHQRYNTILGEFGDEVDQINVGSLNTDLGELALKLGSDDEGAQDAAASLFQFGKNAGASGEEAAKTTERIIALAARSVALKPSLGEVGDVAETMSVRLARGGIFASRLGVSLTAAEINARALRDTGKSTAAELTVYEKTAAAAAIATDKYGDSLDKTITKGSENAAIRQRRLREELENFLEKAGARVAFPFLDLLESSLPVLGKVGDAVGTLGGAALPVLEAGVDGLLPLLSVAVDLLDAIPDPLLASAAAALILGRRFGGIGTAIGIVLPLLESVDHGLASAAVTVGTFAFAGSKLPNVGAKMGAVAGAANVLGSAIGGAEGKAISLAGTGALIGTSIAPGIGTAIGAAAGLTLGFLSGGESAEEMRKRVKGLADEIDKMRSPAKALQAFLTSSGQDFTLGDDLGYVRKQLNALAAESPQAAQRVVDGMEAMIGVQDPLTGKTLLTRDEFEKLSATVDKGADSFTKHDRAAREAAASEQLLIDTTPTASEKILQQKQAVEQFADAAVGKLPGAAAALQTTQTELGKFGLALTDSVSPEAFLANLNESIIGIVSFQGNLEAAVSGGFTNVAAFVAEQGPVVGGAYLQAFLAAPRAVQQATEQALATQASATSAFDAYLRGPFAGVITAASQAGFSGIAPSASTASANAALALAGGVPGIEGAGLAVGTGATRGVKSGVAPIPGVASGAFGSAVTGVAKYTSPAFAAGAAIGSTFSDGLAAGIRNHGYLAVEAAAQVVRDAEAAARREARSASPSKLFAELGRDLTLGMAVGVGSAAEEVVAEAQRIVREAASVALPTPSSSLARVGPRALSDGAIRVEVDTLKIEIHGATTREQARELAAGGTEGALSKLTGATRRRLQVDAVAG